MSDPYGPDRPRPDADLAKATLTLDWFTITIDGVDDAALGRIFAWLLAQAMDAKRSPA